MVRWLLVLFGVPTAVAWGGGAEPDAAVARRLGKPAVRRQARNLPSPAEALPAGPFVFDPAGDWDEPEALAPVTAPSSCVMWADGSSSPASPRIPFAVAVRRHVLLCVWRE